MKVLTLILALGCMMSFGIIFHLGIQRDDITKSKIARGNLVVKEKGAPLLPLPATNLSSYRHVPENLMRQLFGNVSQAAGTKSHFKTSVEFGDTDYLDCDDSYCNINGRHIKKELISRTPRDLFTFLPPEGKFHESFRNPCWKQSDQNNETKLYCIPYFYIMGFTKCGTTDLQVLLTQHPLISSRWANVKESDFIDKNSMGRVTDFKSPVTQDPVSFQYWADSGQYRSTLPGTYNKIPGSHILVHGITLDADPQIVWDNEFWETFHPGRSEPPTTNADLISSIYSGSKMIVMLRDPIQRMRSFYQFYCLGRNVTSHSRQVQEFG